MVNHSLIIKSCLKIKLLKNSTQRTYIKQFLHFLNSQEAIQKIIKLYNYRLERFLKVRILNTNFYLEKKTIVLDIDETLVYSTTNRNEVRMIDDTIFIKVARFGGLCKAYLSYRPNLIKMLNELKDDFEIILYTCGT